MRGRSRVFLDANILFSAAKSDDAVRALVDRVLDGGHECWVDEFVVTEARRNLVAKGPDSLKAFEALLLRLQVNQAHGVDAQSKEAAWLPEKDRPVLAAAIRLHCDFLVTGDRTHFGAGYGKKFGGVAICSPQSMLENL